MDQRMIECYSIWLDDTERIVSFHIVAGYRQENFDCCDFFWNYVQRVQNGL